MRAATLKKPNRRHPRVIGIVSVKELVVSFCVLLASLWDYGKKKKKEILCLVSNHSKGSLHSDQISMDEEIHMNTNSC